MENKNSFQEVKICVVCGFLSMVFITNSGFVYKKCYGKLKNYPDFINPEYSNQTPVTERETYGISVSATSSSISTTTTLPI